MSEPIRMTDKKNTKVLPCSYPGCGTQLIVNKFESSARARCPEHKGRTAPVYSPATKDEEDNPIPVDQSLTRLACPFCHDAEMKIVRVTDMGFMTFKCPECYTAVEIMPQFGPAIIPVAPKELIPLMEKFNETRGGTRTSETPRELSE